MFVPSQVIAPVRTRLCLVGRVVRVCGRVARLCSVFMLPWGVRSRPQLEENG